MFSAMFLAKRRCLSNVIYVPNDRSAAAKPMAWATIFSLAASSSRQISII